MEAKELPARPNLEQYKKQAKDLLKAQKLGDDEAIQRIKKHHTQFGNFAVSAIRGSNVALADAQLIVAREHGLNVCAFTADGMRTLTGAQDHTVILWDVQTGRTLRQFVGHTGPVWALAWSADQRHFLSGAWDKTL